MKTPSTQLRFHNILCNYKLQKFNKNFLLSVHGYSKFFIMSYKRAKLFDCTKASTSLCSLGKLNVCSVYGEDEQIAPRPNCITVS